MRTKPTFEIHVDLRLLLNSENYIYVLVKYFDRFMTKKRIINIACNASLAERY